ncbi:MAG: uncharacterized protein JWN34_3125 [Bryobacterales bacterium]|nr:uncharacterized protein [Bryobacterales bacterium]
MRLKLRVERAVVGRMEEGCHLCRRVGRWLFLALLVGVGSGNAFGRPPGWLGLPDGTLDPRFGVSGIALTQGASSKSVLLPDGKIIVVGQTLARHNVDGSLDATFGDNGVVRGVSGDKVLLQRDGKLLIVFVQRAGALQRRRLTRRDLRRWRFGGHSPRDQRCGAAG